MDRDFILMKILDTYKTYGIKSIYFDCIELIEKSGYRVFSYGKLLAKNPELYELCISCSDEAYTEPISRIVAYNEKNRRCRIDFSLAHELGHIVLGHNGKHDYFEYEANFFASNLLAPRMAIHYAHCKNARDVAKIFQLSEKAAEIAFNDYLRWHRIAAYKMSLIDKKMYQYFYDEDVEKFVYIKETCDCCGKILYNTTSCWTCLNWGGRTSFEYKALDDPLSMESRALYAF